MRRLSVLAALTVLLSLPAIVSAGVVGPNKGDGTLAVRKGRGEIVLQIKGAVIGRMWSGKLTLTDIDPYDEQEPEVRGRIRPRTTRLSDSTTVYKGRRISFRMLEGMYRLRIEGSGVHLSAVGRGWVTLVGDERFADNGEYSLNGEPWAAIPFEKTEKLRIQDASGFGGKPRRGTARP